MNPKITAAAFGILLLATIGTLANPITPAICGVLNTIHDALGAIGGSLVLIMFLYGGLTYIYSADNPGGRKKAKDICVHAIIGGIILTLAESVPLWVGIADLC